MGERARAGAGAVRAVFWGLGRRPSTSCSLSQRRPRCQLRDPQPPNSPVPPSLLDLVNDVHALNHLARGGGLRRGNGRGAVPGQFPYCREVAGGWLQNRACIPPRHTIALEPLASGASNKGHSGLLGGLTSPNTTWRPSSQGVSTVHRKNWLPFVSGGGERGRVWVGDRSGFAGGLAHSGALVGVPQTSPAPFRSNSPRRPNAAAAMVPLPL
jgi:hypothetical protein